MSAGQALGAGEQDPVLRFADFAGTYLLGVSRGQPDTQVVLEMPCGRAPMTLGHLRRVRDEMDRRYRATPTPDSERAGGWQQEQEWQSREGCVGSMTAQKASYFLERFKRDEKMLGPHEQWALDFALASLVQPNPEAGAVERRALAAEYAALVTFGGELGTASIPPAMSARILAALAQPTGEPS